MSQATPEPTWPRVISAEDADARLKDFDLTVEMLHRSIEVGDNKRSLVSQPVYPATYRGYVMWAETLAELRRQLLKLSAGYKIGRTRNYETIYSPEKNHAIAVVAGDSMVGVKGSREPRLTRKKGIKTTERIRRNVQYALFQEALFDVPGVERPPDESCVTWFLLVRATRDKVYLELSWPISLDDDGFVSGWQQRILLPPLPISGAVAPINPDEDDLDDGDDDLVGR